MASDARVVLWGTTIGAVTWVDDRRIGVFQYTPGFRRSNVDVAPLMMPLREFPYEFPENTGTSFLGLPGMLADALPDAFGNVLVDEWLASEGRAPDSMNPVERLCYTGTRGMGALEFQPAIRGTPTERSTIEVSRLAHLAAKVLRRRAQLGGVFKGEDDRKAVEDILRVGTSAGGARAKAILAWNPTTGDFRSGQLPVDPGFEPWIMKLDGVADPDDTTLGDPQGYGKIEYAYHLVAKDCGIEMMPCRLHHEGGRSHFMTRRFDRTPSGDKIHMQSLAAIAHFDYQQPGCCSYEQAIRVARRLGLPQADLEQQILRAVFNVVGRNQDDHVKNIAFLMDRRGNWRLSPAFDLSYARNSRGMWTSQHQMSVHGKRADIDRAELTSLAQAADVKTPKANDIIDQVLSVFRKWAAYAERADVAEHSAASIGRQIRVNL